jgi:hypothetical protein
VCTVLSSFLPNYFLDVMPSHFAKVYRRLVVMLKITNSNRNKMFHKFLEKMFVHFHILTSFVSVNNKLSV